MSEQVRADLKPTKYPSTQLTMLSGAAQTLTLLIEACWHANPEKRPQFTEIVETLTDILKKLPRKRGPSDSAGGGGNQSAGGGCCTVS